MIDYLSAGNCDHIVLLPVCVEYGCLLLFIRSISLLNWCY